jgi:RNA polymerase sigma factor (sigma-70 family)
MRKPQGSGSGVQTVIAAQQGDEQAMADLLAEYLPLIYNIVGRALNGHADADDVVQETMLRAVRCLTDLRDPAAFRSWLVAVTVRQLHDHRQERRAAPVPDLSPDLADPQADFVDRTILRLGLAGQRREVAEATRWLDDGDRELLALWWLETGGELDRADLAAALGLPPGHAAVRIARMKEQLTIARGVVRAVQPGAVCAGLLSITADWDRKPSPLWRKRIARHLRDCRECGAHCDGLIPADGCWPACPWSRPSPRGLTMACLGAMTACDPGSAAAAVPRDIPGTRGPWPDPRRRGPWPRLRVPCSSSSSRSRSPPRAPPAARSP